MENQEAMSPVLELVQAQAEELHAVRRLVGLLVWWTAVLQQRADRRKATADQNHRRWKQRLHAARVEWASERDGLQREATGVRAELRGMTQHYRQWQAYGQRVQGELVEARTMIATLQGQTAGFEQQVTHLLAQRERDQAALQALQTQLQAAHHAHAREQAVWQNQLHQAEQDRDWYRGDRDRWQVVAEQRTAELDVEKKRKRGLFG